ncbi:MAG: hypothetical protein ACU85E_10780 [Gammaproteobacteria bacterium]
MGEFKQSMSDYATRVKAYELAARLERLKDDEWQALYDAFGQQREKFANAVKFMENQATESQFQSLQQSPPVAQVSPLLPQAEFAPRYPDGPTYDAFVATLPGFGLLSDTDLPGTNDDRCDDDGEAGARIANGVLQFAAIAADTLCNTIVVFLGEGTNAPACIAAGVANAAVEADDIVLQQCGYQTALVDSAEIEAAYENTRRIIENQLEIVEKKRIHMQVVGIPAEGCSQGYWKNHTDNWDSSSGMDIVPDFDPGTLFDAVFGLDSDTGTGLRNNATLLDVLSAKGGDTIAQARNAVTLLLNSDAQNAGFALPCSPTIVGDIGSFVLPIQIRRYFLLSSDEAGIPTDVVVDTVNAADVSPMGTTFTDITAMMTSTSVGAGFQEIEIVVPPENNAFDAYQFNVSHDHGTTTLDGAPIIHSGTILVHLDHGSNLGMGQ